MKRFSLLVMAIILAAAAPPPASVLQNARHRLIAALKAHGVVANGEIVERVTYICDIKSDGASLPVAEVLEVVPAAMEPRNFDRIVLLSPDLKPIQQINVTGVSPLFCRDNSFYLSDDAQAPDGSTGNKITFKFGGSLIEMSDVDPLHLPEPAPLSGK
jgi:hypothetical protein